MLHQLPLRALLTTCSFVLLLFCSQAFGQTETKTAAIVVQTPQGTPRNAKLLKVVEAMLKKREYEVLTQAALVASAKNTSNLEEGRPATKPRALQAIRADLNASLLVLVKIEGGAASETATIVLYEAAGDPRSSAVQEPSERMDTEVAVALSQMLPYEDPSAPPAAAAEPTAQPLYMPAPNPDATESDEPVEEKPLWGAGPLAVLRLGANVYGTGTLDYRCSGPNCTAADDRDRDYDEKLGLILGVDAMLAIFPGGRLGAGLVYTPTYSVEAGPGDTNFEVGSSLGLNGILEGLLIASPEAALGLQVRGGPVFFFPGGDFQDQIDAAKDFCSGSSSEARCDVDTGPFIGWTVGPGLGLHFAANELVRIRLDTFFEFYGSFLGEFIVDDAAGRTVNSLYTDGFRIWTSLGFEIGAGMDEL